MDWLQPFGNTGLAVSRLGFGGGHVGSPTMDDKDAGILLNALLDSGVKLIDTARGYDLSEQRIGKHISHRRSEFVLSTKVGYGVDGIDDWTPEIIEAGIERALKLMKTEVLDICHLHSCPLDTLKNSGVVEALGKAREAGKIKVAAYSGENEELAWAVECGQFQSVQTSVNFCDQLSLNKWLPLAAQKEMGVIGKRPVANMCWTYKARPVGQYAEEYWVRWKAMGIDPQGLDWHELALRFSAYAPGVSSVIVGTKDMDHFAQNVAVVQKGPLPAELLAAVKDAYTKHGGDWTGQI